MKIQDITGQTFGRWTVLGYYDSVIYPKCTTARWLCRCQCGQEKPVRGNTLKNGTSVSCGCHKTELQVLRQTTHGMSKSPEYAAWAHMMDRCTNPGNPAYKDYGARGITVCERWQDASSFLVDIGPRPTPRHSLERKNNEGIYTPENCEWATPPVQQNNKRSNRRLRFNGRVQTISQWSAELGISSSNIWNRLLDGWSTTDALSTPVDDNKGGWNNRRKRQGR